jgi:hypothetical protein
MQIEANTSLTGDSKTNDHDSTLHACNTCDI